MILTPHLKHIIITFIIAVGLFSVAYEVVSYLRDVAHDQRVLADEALAIQREKNKQDAAKSDELQKKQDKIDSDNQDIKNRTNADNIRLQAQINDLKSKLAAQQNTDKNLPPTEQAARITTLIGGVPGDVKVLPDGLLFSPSASKTTVVMLDETYSLRQTNSNLESIITNNNERIKSDEVSIAGLHEQVGQLRERVSGLQAEIKKTNDDWEKQKKDDSRTALKGKLKWAATGIGIGMAIVKLVF